MFQQILTMCRQVSTSMRRKPARRSTCLAATLLEERATPAVVDGITQTTIVPETVQFATVSREANVRADLFGSGAISPIHQDDEMAWLANTPEAPAFTKVEADTYPAEEQWECANGTLTDLDQAA